MSKTKIKIEINNDNILPPQLNVVDKCFHDSIIRRREQPRCFKVAA